MQTLILLAALAAGQAETPKPAAKEEPGAKVKALVKQLDSAQLARRDAAEKELRELGESIIEHLPPITANTPAEIKTRINRLRKVLLDEAIASTSKASLVTLEGEHRFSEAIAAVQKQTGNRFEDYREKFNQLKLDPPLTLKLNKTPFWEALDTILDDAEMTIYSYDEETDSLAYTARGEAAPRKGTASYSGPFRFQAVRVETTRDLRNAMNRSLRVAVEAAWEPRVRPIVLQQPLTELKVIDDEGREIGVRGEGEVETPVENNNAGVELELPLELPERSAKKIKSITGKMSATIPGRLEEFRFTGLDKIKDESQERGGVTVTLKHARKNADIFDVEINLRFDKAANALESHRGWIYNNPAFLIDGKGERIENAGLEATLAAVNEVNLSFKFDLEKATLAQCSFVYKTPAAIFKVPIEFELKDIELP